MKNKIFKMTAIIVTSTLIVFSLIITYLLYLFYKNEAIVQLKNIVNIVMDQNYTYEELNTKLKENINYDVRLTIILENGEVVYDNYRDATELSNHANREEMIEAIKNNSGESIRHSESIGYNSYYYAVKKNDEIYRFSRKVNSIFSVFFGVIPIILTVNVFILLITLFFSMKLSNKLMKPIKELVKNLDLLNDSSNELTKVVEDYDELVPIAVAMENLSSKIKKYIMKIKNEKDTINIITNNMLEGMLIIDKEYKILLANKSVISMFNENFTFDEEKDLMELTRNIQLLEALKNIGENSNSQLLIEQNDRLIRVYLNKLKFANEFGYILIFVDVTEHIKSENIRREFSANVSHELKTPLTTIKGFGEMFEAGMIDDKKDVIKYGSMIKRESERLLFLINDIMRISELEEKKNYIFETFKIVDITNSVMEILSSVADKKNVTIKTQIQDIIIKANEKYLQELLINLIDNSIKYNKPNGEIFLNIYEDEKNVNIIVEDTGIGIEEEDRSRIFERFYRADKSHSKLIGGTGLGLSIVKHIVAYHNGNIKLESKLGVGTKIMIVLPKAIGDH
jgi:two-component system, OmpR family, phosphate regulon sensor histidine kinase PhoR